MLKQLTAYGAAKGGVRLARFSSFKIGGPAEFFITVENTEKLSALLSFLRDNEMPYFILGGGSNVLFPDDGLRGVVIKFVGKKITQSGSTVTAEAGATLASLVDFTTSAGLAGFEWAAGIPGSVGGAVRGNAGARYAFAGGEMKDNITTVRAWSNGEVIDIANADCAFTYRDSAFKHNNDVVLSATIALTPGDKTAIVATTQKIIKERLGKHAVGASAGSFFKNVFLSDWKHDQAVLPQRFVEYKKIAAGWLIEQAGLKGVAQGGAQVSPTHANFIVNGGKATQADVLALVEKVQTEVYNKFGITLEPEVQIVPGGDSSF